MPFSAKLNQKCQFLISIARLVMGFENFIMTFVGISMLFLFIIRYGTYKFYSFLFISKKLKKVRKCCGVLATQCLVSRYFVGKILIPLISSHINSLKMKNVLAEFLHLISVLSGYLTGQKYGMSFLILGLG